VPERSTQHRSGVPWWAPLLALAALVAGVAAAAVVTHRDRDPHRQTHSVLGTQATLTDRATTAMTTTVKKAAPRRLDAVAGRYFVVQNVRVLDVVGDRIFWIAPSAGKQMLVHLQGRGTRYAIRRGQRLSFRGLVTRNAPRSAEYWGLSFAEGRGRFRAQGVHLEVFGPRIRFR
jgi:hypothetical protein